ncbi:MAG TPA: T9SS type A sorting domain-containing protein [Crocinitomicaceae bacterium]|nr:T9SS type A sorting domain-containing protein [Crocinitomicaceae bacterium]
MKKTLLSLFVLLGVCSSYSQVEIYTVGQPTEISGTTIDVYTSNSNLLTEDLHFVNKMGSDQNWAMTRVIINEIATWEDYFCWGSVSIPGNGQCYSAAAMNTNPWTSPDSWGVLAGDTALLNVDITPNIATEGTVTYRYYVGPDATTFLDSIDVRVHASTASIEENSLAAVSVAPNPASDYLSVKTFNLQSPSIKILDVLGNIVFSKTKELSSSNINISNFKNGVYFVVIESSNSSPITKRFIVKH